MSSKSTLKLRLAARTLLEWRTPPSSEEYRLLLQDIFSVHPVTTYFHLTIPDKILASDDHGALLLYLSDTLDNPPIIYPSRTPQWESYLGDRFHNLFESQILSRRVSKGMRPLISQNYKQVERLLDLLAEVVRNGGLDTAYEEFINIYLHPVDEQLNSSINRLMQKVDIGHTEFRRLTAKTKLGTYLLLSFQVAAPSAVGIIMYARRRDLPLNIYDLNNLVEKILLPFGFIVAALMPLVKAYRRSLSSFIRRIAGKRNEALRDLYRRLYASDHGTGMFDMLVRMCSKNPHIFRRLLLHVSKVIKVSREYSKLLDNRIEPVSPPHQVLEVLLHIRVVNIDLIRASLNSLIDSEIDASIRQQVFFWLCQVKGIKTEVPRRKVRKVL